MIKIATTDYQRQSDGFGIKLSLFDVSGLGKSREIDRMVIGGLGSTKLQNNIR